MAAVSAAMGRPFMPHQRLIVDVMLEVQSDEAGDPEPGEWAYDDLTATIQRRGGKTAIITPVAAHRMRQVDRARVFMTAQTGKKARARWLDVTDDLLKSPLSGDVTRKISHTFEELRWLSTGSLLVPFAPNEEEMHSETPDLVFVDELWSFSAEQKRQIQAGYVPAFATTSGQAWKFSTAGHKGSDWLNADRAAGRKAVDGGVRLGRAYVEYGIPKTVDGVEVDSLSDAAVIQACIDYHPAVCHEPECPGPGGRRPCPHGFTVRPAAIRSAFEAMDDRPEFVRAYGNRSVDDRSTDWQGLDRDVFLRQLDESSIPTNAGIALGVWVDEDAEDAAIVAGWRDETGHMHTEVVRREIGTRWLSSAVAGLTARHKVRTIALANVGPQRDVGDTLEAGGYTVQRIAQADVTAASVRHREELAAGTWWHRMSDDLTAAAAAVGWQGRWTKGSAPVSALVAGTFAGWGFDHAPVELPRFWIG